ncbi:MAG: hypothetical protein LIO87_09230 [Eubacterium sp.]|nr:hypothetical protein [Eubacterium sp.]
MKRGKKREKKKEEGIFLVEACYCKRCGGLLTSKEGIEAGYGHVCKQKVIEEQPDPNQITFSELEGSE